MPATSPPDADAHEPTTQRISPIEWVLTGVCLVITVGMTIGLVMVPGLDEWMRSLGAWGYIGIFVLMAVGNATIVLPSPALVIALVAGATLNPLLAGLACGAGATLGEVTAYFAGLAGSTLAQRSRHYARVHAMVERHGGWVIFVLAVVPGPLFDLAGIAAGTLRMNFWHFLLPCLLGKTLRFTLITVLVSLGVDVVNALGGGGPLPTTAPVP